jgi:hypothetical protein
MNWYKTANWEIDDSLESLEQEQWDAQGETQQFLGPSDKIEDLFRKKIEIIPIKDIVSEDRINGFKMLIQKQKEYGREIIDSLKKSIINGDKIPPVTIQKNWNGKWKLVSGRHRILAALELGINSVPVMKMEWIN